MHIHEYADFCTASLNIEIKVRMKIGEGTQCSYCSYVRTYNIRILFCDNRFKNWEELFISLNRQQM